MKRFFNELVWQLILQGIFINVRRRQAFSAFVRKAYPFSHFSSFALPLIDLPSFAPVVTLVPYP